MIYILNTNINPKKKISTALLELYGLGKYQSSQLCNALGISNTKYIKQLTPNELVELNSFLTQNYEIGIDIKRTINKNIQRLITIGAYRGFRHSQGLPVRGQRTHGNARTIKKRYQNLSLKTSK